MTEGTDALKLAFRDYITDGIPATGPNEPVKSEVRTALDSLALDIVAAGAGGDLDAVRAVIEPIRDEAQEGAAKSQAWAESPTAPDPLDPTGKSAKTIADEMADQLNAFRINTYAAPITIEGWSRPVSVTIEDDVGNVVMAIDVDGLFLTNKNRVLGDFTLDTRGAVVTDGFRLEATETANAFEFIDSAENILLEVIKSGVLAGRFNFAFPPLVNGQPISSRNSSGAANAGYIAESFADDDGLLQIRVEDRATGRITFTTASGNNYMPSLSTDNMLVFTSDAQSGLDEVVFVPADGTGEITPIKSRGTLLVTMGDSNSSDVEGYYPQLAAVAVDRTTFMAGWSRQTTPQIAARQNGIPCTITVSGNSIPGSGTATITAMSTRFLSQAGLAVAKQMDVRVNGVDCTIYKDAGSYTNPATYADVYTIGRKVAGAAVAVAAGTPVYTINGINNRVGTQIMWPGRNDGAAALMSVTKPGVQAMIAYLSPLSKHYLIFGIVPSGYPTTAEIFGTTPHTQIRAYNDDMLATYGDAMDATHSGRFFDIHTYFVNRAAGTSQCMIDAGLTPTADDLTDIANGIPPRQIVTQDTTGFHFTVAARQQVSARILEILAAKGW